MYKIYFDYCDYFLLGDSAPLFAGSEFVVTAGCEVFRYKDSYPNQDRVRKVVSLLNIETHYEKKKNKKCNEDV